MTKQHFIDTLTQGLKKHNIHDVDDIITDYEDYFNQQLALGKTESDIAIKLGDVKTIISDYVKSGSKGRAKWFDLVTVGFIAIPMLIILYGLLIVFGLTVLTSWSLAIYYLFQLDTFAFMPYIPFGIHFVYILLFLVFSLFFFTLTVRFYATTKSMTMQYVVKQAIRIGDYHIKPIYIKLFNISSIISLFLFNLGYFLSALVAKDFQYWHVWEWFQ
jgi:uncharacterized membrane protein